MKKENVKLEDILITAEVSSSGEWQLTSVEVKSFDLDECDIQSGLNVVCEVLSDDPNENGAILKTHTDCLFNNRKEAIEYVVKRVKEIRNEIDTDLFLAKVELGAEIERERLFKDRKKIGLDARSSVKLISLLSTKLCNHAFFNDVFHDIGENSEFIKALDIVKVVLFQTLNEADEMGDRLINAIFGNTENDEEGK